MSDQTTPTANPARLIYDQASAEKRLGSRISRKQLMAVTETEGKPKIGKAKLSEYATTGDADGLSDAERLELRNFVGECKAHEILENDSQRRRLWPRKVAAILAFS